MIKQLLRSLPEKTLAKLDRSDAAQGQPFNKPEMMRPHLQSKQYGWTHYGVMIPDLPAPHQFFSIMSVIGTPGALAFDTDHALKTHPRGNATVVSGTAATWPRHFDGYDIANDCDMAEDGSHIQFGKDVTITGTYPEYKVQSSWGNFELDIALTCSDKVSWFVKNPIYDHLSLLSQYEGSVRLAGRSQCISGLCTFEYACCPSPYLLTATPLPDKLKVPLDFFTYQIVNLPQDRQLLFAMAMVKGVPILKAAYLRSLLNYSATFREVDFEVEQYQTAPLIAPDGKSMRVPEVFNWKVCDKGQPLLELQGRINTPMTYGLGSGYVGGFEYQGQMNDEPISGQAYIEYIDRR